MSETAIPGRCCPGPRREKHPAGRILAPVLCLLVLLCAASAHALSAEEENNIAVYRKASRGVVNITSITVDYDFFLNPVPREGAGSGVIIDKRGYILTNNHVIKNARRLEVTLFDQSRYQGKLVGAYPEQDLAVIKIDAPQEVLHPVPMGDSSSLQVGQKVLAIGNPFGLGETLTTGVVSSLGRSLTGPGGERMDDLIQTDASINPGNSGGPLLDSSGNIIGINTAIFTPSGGSVGIGFAIPIDVARRIVPDLIERGYVAYPWMGVSLFPLFPALARALELPVEQGVMITRVAEGSPAEAAGLSGAKRLLEVGNALLPVGGDIIVAIDEKPVASPQELIRLVRRKRPGDTISVIVVRKGKKQNISLTLRERPRESVP
ncbi:MAG: trypsin-like peptidase domain-containing protein [Deltaproteobacteria bacterium]|nr:trypsin-like peptidase domain-containing protein [Deltaproteobacteria bacterium]